MAGLLIWTDINQIQNAIWLIHKKGLTFLTYLNLFSDEAIKRKYEWNWYDDMFILGVCVRFKETAERELWTVSNSTTLFVAESCEVYFKVIPF